MSKLIVLTLMGHNGLWIARTLADNCEELFNIGIEIVPSDKGSGNLMHHSQLWLDPENNLDRFIKIKDNLSNGRSQLVLNYFCPPSSQENFAKTLMNIGIQLENIWVGIVPSRISTLFEGIGKSLYGNMNVSDYNEIPSVKDLLNQSVPILLQNIASFGNSLHITADISDAPSNEVALEIVRNLCQKWGVNPQLKHAKPVYNNLCYKTASAIRLLNSMRVRDNDWPRMDDQAYMDVLLNFDKQWKTEPCLPLAMRRNIIHDPLVQKVQKKFNSLCRVENNAFDFPEWFAEVPDLRPETPLDNEKVESFARELSAETASILLDRFSNGKRFLDDDQKLFAEKLALVKGGDANFSILEMGSDIPTLTVLTMTCNHEKYIAECMDSVLMQETDFPVQHLVLDHYSCDGTPDIINAYAKQHSSIMPILLRPGSIWRSNVRELLGRCQSEYAALCDGDDYFTAPHKLQKQVDFLRENPQCSLVFHPVEVKFEDGSPSFFYPPISGLPRGIKKEYYLSDLAKGNLIQTNSVVYRWRFRDGLPDWFRDDLCPGDWYWHLLHAEVGKIGFMREVMSVYRRHANALYCHAFIDSIEHRRKTGMAELEAYKVYNDHFKGRYFLRFGNLAAGIFSDFAEIGLKENNTSLLDEATEKYPEFARHFLEMYKKQIFM